MDQLTFFALKFFSNISARMLRESYRELLNHAFFQSFYEIFGLFLNGQDLSLLQQ